MHRVVKITVTIGFLLVWGLFVAVPRQQAQQSQQAQQRQSPPPDHPEVKTPDQRAEASRLTEKLAGGTTAVGGHIPRKNLIDEHLFGAMERDGIPHAPLASDTEFLRRAYLDLTGRIPDPKEVREFVAANDPAKRDQLVDKLVGSQAFLEKWTYYFGDLARAAHNRIGVDGRNLWYKYIYDCLELNMPYQQMVEEILTAQATSNWYVGPATYLVRWVVEGDMPAIMMHEDTADEMTVNVAKHFLGVDLSCISCHDGANHLEKINLWLTGKRRKEFWQQAAFFGRTYVKRRVNVSEHRDEYSIKDNAPGYDASAKSVVRIQRNGQGRVEPVFIFSGEPPRAGVPLRQELARLITSHPQFARHTVNLFWTELMGVGIVDPPYSFDLARLDPKSPPPKPWTIQPTNPKLLEALAEDFRKSNYDLRHLFKRIAKSSAYGLSARFPGRWQESYAKYYARKFVRRLSAEELHDAVVKATGVATPIPVLGTDIKATYATQLRSTEDLSRQDFKELRYVLESFGQSNREQYDRNTDGSVIQAVLWMNSRFIRERAQARPDGRLGKLLAQQPALTDDQLLEELFLAFLSRPPSAEEAVIAKELLSGSDRTKGAEDLQWALMNKLDFIFNH